MIELPQFDDGRTYMLRGVTLNQIMKAIRERTPLKGDNTTLRYTEHGVIINGQAGASSCAFDGIWADDVFYFQTAGTLNGLTPTNMFDSGELSALTCVAPKWVVLDVTAADNVVQSCEIVVQSAAPDPIGSGEGTAPDSFQIGLFYVNSSGTVFRLIGCGSLWATPVEILVTANPAPDPCGDPYIRHYSWEVSSV